MADTYKIEENKEEEEEMERSEGEGAIWGEEDCIDDDT